MARQRRNWHIEYDAENDRFYKVHNSTGEILDIGTSKTVWNKDRILSAEQQEAQENYKKQQEKKSRRRKISKENGDHYFVPRLHTFPDLKPQTAARLIYLFTYADYSERGGHLMLTHKTEMKKKDLPKVLGLSDDAVKIFLDEVCPIYMTIDDKGGIAATSVAFQRGALKDGRTYHRLYDQWVRRLYKELPSRQHRYLGYIFQLLPYISIEYNVLCYNPMEEDSGKIEFMRLGDFCKEIDFDSSHAERLLKIYKQIRFPVTDENGTHLEKFFSVTYDGLNRHEAKMYVNPRILYSGSHPEHVELLGAFSKD